VGHTAQSHRDQADHKDDIVSVAAVMPRPSLQRTSWIVSKKVDIVWFSVGGAVLAYSFWLLWRFAHVPLLLLVAVWAIVFDETHGFATISRTYFDAQERERRGRWLWGSMAFFFAIGPILIVLRLADWLELATELWGYFHIYRQHYGFMMMYKKKNADLRPQDNRIDQLFFVTAFYYPFVTYPLHSKEAADLLPFPISVGVGNVIEHALLSLVILIALVYASRQWTKWRKGLPMNWPKQLLLASAIPVNFVLFRSSMPLLGVYAAATIFHNVQYHRLVWFYNQNKYGSRFQPVRAYGFATLINSRWLSYVALAGVYALIFDFTPRFILEPHIGAVDANLRNQLVFSFFAAPGLLHYWLDGHIWKVRSDPELRTYLQLDRP
jgi:hypothetical protein